MIVWSAIFGKIISSDMVFYIRSGLGFRDSGFLVNVEVRVSGFGRFAFPIGDRATSTEVITDPPKLTWNCKGGPTWTSAFL